MPASSFGTYTQHFRSDGLLVLTTVGNPPAFAYVDGNAVIDRALETVGEAPLGQVDSDGVVSAGGVTVAGDEGSVARMTTNGAQVIAVLEKRSQARYRLDVPPRARVESGPDGSLVVYEVTLEGAALLAMVEAPWAVDATGKVLPTSYDLRGRTLVQNIDTSGATYPVVADPTVSVGWDWPWGAVFKVRFSKGDVNNIIRYRYDWAAGALMTIVCAAVAVVNPAAGIACGIIGGFAAESIISSFKAAYNRNPNNCVYMKFTINGIPLE